MNEGVCSSEASNLEVKQKFLKGEEKKPKTTQPINRAVDKGTQRKLPEGKTLKHITYL